MSGYREPGLEADRTVIECTRIRESEETKRKALEIRAEERTTRRAQWLTWSRDSVGMEVLVTFGGLGIIGSACACAVLYALHLWHNH